MNPTDLVRNWMSTQPVSVQLDASPSQVQALLEGHAFHHLPVLDGDVLVGVVSALDLARVSLRRWVTDADTERAWLDETFRVADLMTWEPACVRADDTLRHAADALSSGAFHSLPVLDGEDRLVGILTSTDVVRAVAAG